jgi:hypothetical protein
MRNKDNEGDADADADADALGSSWIRDRISSLQFGS